MNFFAKIKDKLYTKQWTIGLAAIDLDTLLSGKWKPDNVKWLPIRNKHQFWADPFFFAYQDKWLVFYEDYHYMKQYGTISCCLLNQQFEMLEQKELLDTGYHLSYPNYYQHDGKVFILPESSMEGGLHAHELDLNTLQIIRRHTILPHLPLLDSTILFHDNKFWIFATQRGNNSNKDLYIFYSDQWDGIYSSHEKNPVKSDLFGSRPAGQFFKHMGKIYRPAQNASSHYGQSVIIHEITELTTSTFKETYVTEITPAINSNYNFGIHTINLSNNVIVVDGLRRIFNPLTQIMIFLKKIIQFRHK